MKKVSNTKSRNLSYYFNLRPLQIIIVALVAFACYFNTLSNGFAWDDRDFIFDWPQIKDSYTELPAYLNIPSLLMGDVPQIHRGVYRPVRSIFYLVSYSFFKENPFGYHAQALIIHLLISITIYLIVEVVTHKKIPALITACLFAAHPVHTEAVSFVTASFDTIGILFFFMAFYFYVKFREGADRKNSYLFASILYGSVAFYTYEMTLVLPLLLILYDFCTLNYSFRKIFSKRDTYQYFFLSLIVYGLIRFIILAINDRSDLGVDFSVVSNQARVGMPEIYLTYFSYLLRPFDLTVSHQTPSFLLNNFLWFLHGINNSNRLIDLSAQIVLIFPIIYAFLIILLGFLLLRKFPWAFFAFAWIFITLLPASNILPQGAVIGLRFLYIPSFGFVLLLGLMFSSLITFLQSRKLFYLEALTTVLLLIVLTSYSFLTIQRNFDWKNEKVFWESIIKMSPWDKRPYRALGEVYINEGDLDTALKYFKQVLDNNPQSAQNNSDVGVIYVFQGNLDQAELYEKKALEIDPQYYRANMYLGDIYLQQKRYEEAEKEYNKAITFNKKDYQLYIKLGDVYFKTGDYKKALENYSTSAEINSYVANTQYQIGLTHLKLSHLPEAEKAFFLAIELDPKLSNTYKELANIYLKRNDQKKAREILNEGISQTNDQELKKQLTDLGNN